MAILKKCKVSFASVTNPEGHKNGKHLLGVYVTKDFKKQFEKDFNKVWEDNKTSKAKKPAYAVKDWFSKDEKTNELIFWTTAKADKDRGIIFKQGKGCDFTEDDFEVMGTGSVIDLEYDVYYYNSADYGEMVNRSIKAISLREFVKYEGGSDIEGDEIGASKKSKKDDKKSKKDKKKGKKVKEDKPEKSDKKDKKKKSKKEKK